MHLGIVHYAPMPHAACMLVLTGSALCNKVYTDTAGASFWACPRRCWSRSRASSARATAASWARPAAWGRRSCARPRRSCTSASTRTRCSLHSRAVHRAPAHLCCGTMRVLPAVNPYVEDRGAGLAVPSWPAHCIPSCFHKPLHLVCITPARVALRAASPFCF
jgi:hypothetical protein